MLPIVLSLSLVLDALAGEPPSKLHPVVWMGKYLSWMKKQNKASGWLAFWQGFLLFALGLVVVALIAGVAILLLRISPNWLTIIWLAVLLKPMFSVRSLLDAGESIKEALESGDLVEARRLLSWNLVSRDTSSLGEAGVAGAAISSLAENITDSIVAPLFYFVLFEPLGLGLVAAALYRFANTADAMLGYRNKELEYFGKSAARLDDVLNFVPARLTAVLLFMILFCMGKYARKGLTVARHANLPSPNGGWTMGMVAGGLDIILEKKDVYRLNETGAPASAAAITTVQHLIIAVTALFTLISLGWHYAA